jgi:hypothetical protein
MISKHTRLLTVYDGAKYVFDLSEGELVYSFDLNTKLPVVREIESIKVFENVELVEVKFDSGLYVGCSEDFGFYSFRGNKVLAKDLLEGQSIRAFSTMIHKDGHWRVLGFSNGKVKHQYTARMVWECFHGKIENELILHHIDYNKLNNKLSNLMLMTNSDHNKIHINDRVRRAIFRKGGNHKVVSISPIYIDTGYEIKVKEFNTFVIADPGDKIDKWTGIVAGL